MYLIHKETDKRVDVQVETLQEKDFKIIKASKQFEFNWNEEKQYQCFKLIIKGSDQIMGLMSIKEFRSELWLKINILESSKENVGGDKKYDRIAGCLIAYACKLAFIKGYSGLVALEPKTQLFKHYINKYSMKSTGKYLYLELRDSENVIRKYMEDHL